MKRNSPATRSTLSPKEVLRSAVAIADREGIEAVSMRRLAREHGVTPMALYWHFEDKDALLDRMAEHVVTDADFTDLAGAGWEQRLRRVLVTLVDLLRGHPWMGRQVIERLVPLPNYLAAFEIMLDSARQAGLSSAHGALLCQQAVQSVVALAVYEPRHKPDQSAECSATEQLLGDLPAGRFPNIRAAAEVLTTPPDLDDYYRLGIDAIVGGIATVAEAGRRD